MQEQGIIGSTEFVEDYITLLQEKMVAYINIDVAASGQMAFKPAATPNFRYDIISILNSVMILLYLDDRKQIFTMTYEDILIRH